MYIGLYLPAFLSPTPGLNVFHTIVQVINLKVSMLSVGIELFRLCSAQPEPLYQAAFTGD